MTYCVVWQDGWRVALLSGKHKDVMPGTFRRVRDAIRQSNALNMALWAAETRPVAANAD